MRSVTKLAACLCLLLTLWSAVGVAVHHHSNDAESLTCPVCAVARTRAVTTIVSGPKPVYLCLSTVPLESIPSTYRLVVFALSVRPPPAA
jgi:hypothetical protein